MDKINEIIAAEHARALRYRAASADVVDSVWHQGVCLPPSGESVPGTELPEVSIDLVAISGLLGPAQGLANRIRDCGFKLAKQDGDGLIIAIAGNQRCALAVTDGRSATERASETGIHNLVLLDFCLDYHDGDTIAVAVADQADERVANVGMALLQQLGFAVHRLDDLPGLIVARTLSRIVNQLADELMIQGEEPEDLDQAFLDNGWGKAPLRWSDHMGGDRLFKLLNHLNDIWPGEGFNPALLMRRHAAADRGFYPLDLIAKARQIHRDGL